MRHSVVLVAGLFLVISMHAVAEGVVSDNFNDGVLDSALWNIEQQDPTAFIKEENGVLKIGGQSGTGARVDIRHLSPVADDDSVWIDYNWITHTDHKCRWQLGIWSDYLQDGVVWNLVPNNIGANEHWAGLHRFEGGAAITVSAAEPFPGTGRLRIDRAGTEFSGYYWEDSDWVLFGTTELDLGNAEAYAYISTSNSNRNPAWQVHLDNFNVVPEPSTLTLLAMAAVGLVAFARRTRRC